MLQTAVCVAAITAFAFTDYVKDSFYWPAPSGPPAGWMQGILTGYGRGNHSGALRIRRRGKEVSFYVSAPPFTIDGRSVRCALPPQRGYVPPRDMCEDWPSRVVIGKTVVHVPYWRGRRYGKPTLIARGFTVVR